MSKFFHELLPMNVDFLAKYPDFFSFFIVILLSLLLSIGVKESSILNNIFTTINLATVCLVIGTGIFKCTYFIGFLLVQNSNAENNSKPFYSGSKQLVD